MRLITNIEEIKNCPFCNSKANLNEMIKLQPYSDDYFYISCSVCGIRTNDLSDVNFERKEVIQKLLVLWNTRHYAN